MTKSWGKIGERKSFTLIEWCSVFSGGKIILNMYFLHIIFNNQDFESLLSLNIISDLFWVSWS